MATGTLILRPSADVSIEHEKKPESSANAYLLIDEKVADDDSTYLQLSDDKTAIATSSFKMNSFVLPQGIVKINDFHITYRVYVSSASVGVATYTNEFSAIVTISGTDTSKITVASNVSAREWVDCTVNSTDAITLLNAKLSSVSSTIPIKLTVDSSLASEVIGKATVSLRITQVYITIEYEYDENIGVYHKVGGAWKPATAAYKKVNGVWTEITGDECKAYLREQFGVT